MRDGCIDVRDAKCRERDASITESVLCVVRHIQWQRRGKTIV